MKRLHRESPLYPAPGPRVFCAIVLLLLATTLPGPAQWITSARQIVDLSPGPSGSYPSNFSGFDGAVYFSAYTTNTGRELWKYDGSVVTLTSNINETATDIGFGVLVGNDSNPGKPAVFNQSLYFCAYDPRRGGELWSWNGTNAARVADINPDLNDTIKVNPASSWPTDLTVFGSALYFSANGGPKTNYELWKFDGALASLAANIHPDSGSDYSSYPQGLTVFDGSLYFMADDSTHGYELWKLTGTNATLQDINPGNAGSSSYPKYFTQLNGRLYFQAFHSLYGYELWQTDGTNVSMVADLNPGTASSYPEHLTVFKGALYFSATDGVHGNQLWKYDGVSATVVSNINPYGDSYPKNLTVFGDQLCFAATDGIHGWELWAFDGTNAWLAADINPAGDSFPESLTVVDKLLYFSATSPDTGYELWRYDGSTSALAADLNPGPGSSYPMNFGVINHELFLSAADDGVSNWEPWVISTTASAAKPVALANPVMSGSDLLFSFTGEPGQTYELQSSDSLAGGNWQTLATFTGTGAPLTITNSLLLTGQCFYRIESK